MMNANKTQYMNNMCPTGACAVVANVGCVFSCASLSLTDCANAYYCRIVGMNCVLGKCYYVQQNPCESNGYLDTLLS